MVTFSYLAQGRDGYQLLTIVLTKNKVLMKNKVLTKKGEVPHASCMQTQMLKKTSVSAVSQVLKGVVLYPSEFHCCI